MTEILETQIREYSERINSVLSDIISGYKNNTLNTPEMSELIASMEYSLLAGGKRIRPFLVYSFCKLCGKEIEYADMLAAAIEMVHTYSLIHDDLPCMDNDELRRGKATNHKVFGEATALLAGDALLTEAFNVISTSQLSDSEKVASISMLSKNAGALGMIGGQEIDLRSEGKQISLETLYALQGKKTGMLFLTSCLFGCVAAGVTEGSRYDAASEFAREFGLAFQITDDILDVTATSDELGKNAGSDLKENKSTIVTHLGLEKARKTAEEHIKSAKTAITNVFDEDKCKALIDLCDYLLTRRN